MLVVETIARKTNALLRRLSPWLAFFEIASDFVHVRYWERSRPAQLMLRILKLTCNKHGMANNGLASVFPLLKRSDVWVGAGTFRSHSKLMISLDF